MNPHLQTEVARWAEATADSVRGSRTHSSDQTLKTRRAFARGLVQARGGAELARGALRGAGGAFRTEAADRTTAPFAAARTSHHSAFGAEEAGSTALREVELQRPYMH